MNVQELVDRLAQSPFRAFRLHLSGGVDLEIPAPGLVLLSEKTAVIGLPHPNLPPPRCLRFLTVDLRHITHLEDV